MPSRQIIPSCRVIVQQQLLPRIPARWRRQCQFGIQAFTLKPFTSLASNARQTVAHPDTAATKVDRLMCNAGLAGRLDVVVAGLGFVRPLSLVNCDHSDFNGLTALVGAVQTGKGRAVPCLVATTYAQHLPAHDQTPKRKQKMRAARQELDYGIYDQVRATLEEFAGHLGFWPRFVFDRGFMSLKLVQLFTRNQAIFYVRLKADRLVELGGVSTQVCRLEEPDTQVTVAGADVRVIRSEQSDDDSEPWYILTSDMNSTREQVIRIYYHRFEIEETFKDIKHILKLESVRFTKPLSLKALLWFASLSLILSFLTGWWTPKIHRPHHAKKALSWFRQFFEALEREIRQPVCLMITGGN